MVKIAVIAPDMTAHLGGCADIKREVQRAGRDYARAHTTHEAETLLQAILDTDEDLADAFGETAYQAGSTHWGVFNMDVKPCLADALRAAGITFEGGMMEVVYDGQTYNERAEGHGRPVQSGTPAAKAILGQYGICNCGCGGSPKGKNSRFLPGHDMRVGHGRA